jgi:hypothetical protein
MDLVEIHLLAGWKAERAYRVALEHALREHEEALILVGRWEPVQHHAGPDPRPRPRAAETRAALLAAMAPAPLDVNGHRLAGCIAFLRENFRNDGAEGESVHRLCDDAEALARGAQASAPPPDVEALRAQAIVAGRAVCCTWHPAMLATRTLVHGRMLDVFDARAASASAGAAAIAALAALLLALPTEAP